MFSNHYSHKLDEEGRLVFPARWREELGPSLVITRGLDQCLFVFPADKFERLARQFERISFVKSDGRTLSRYLFAEAWVGSPDDQGRIPLSPFLRSYAGLSSEVTIVGVNERIEIWEPQRYAQVDARIEADAVTVAERMGEALQNILSTDSG